MLKCSEAGKHKECQKCDHSKEHPCPRPVLEGTPCTEPGVCGWVKGLTSVFCKPTSEKEPDNG